MNLLKLYSPNEKLNELIDIGQVSLRSLKDNAKVFDELVFDINLDYFEKHSGYEFAKEVKWTKRCKDKSLIGTTKEIINQVSYSKKWKSAIILNVVQYM